MTGRFGFLLATALLAGCARAPQVFPAPEIDSEIAAEISRIRAIDNHAHPVRVVPTGASPDGAPPDRDFDALPVDHMEPQIDPVALRPGGPLLAAALKDLYGGQGKPRTMQEKGEGYPAWVLDRIGVDVMLANRVEMGASVQPPRFRWVPYADALLFPLDNSNLRVNSDRKSFFALEDALRGRYLGQAGLKKTPATLAEYLGRVVTPTLERHRQGGAIAEKFEAAYLRSLAFLPAEAAVAERVYRQFNGKAAPPDAEYKMLQDYLFRYVARECGRLGMAVHLHTMAGAGGYFDVAGANPLHLETVLNDPTLRTTKFVMVHGGWPFTGEMGALLTKPNAYLDYSAQSLLLPAARLAGILREWLELVPEKVMFGTDAYPYSNEMGWEESGWIAAKTGRQALAIALSGMLRDGEISRQRAPELARMVLRENARNLYGF
jgi:uncharacterized protein